MMSKMVLAGILVLLALVPGANTQSMNQPMNPFLNRFPMVLYKYPVQGGCLSPDNAAGICGDGSKVVGKIVAVNGVARTLQLAVRRLPVNAGNPDLVDTLTVDVSPQTVLMRDGRSLSLTSLDALNLGATIGVMGGLATNGEMQARCLGEDCAKMARVVTSQPLVP
jgi:hypothetical protein